AGGGRAGRPTGASPCRPSWPGGSTCSAPTSPTCPPGPSPPCRSTCATTSRGCPWTAAPTGATCSAPRWAALRRPAGVRDRRGPGRGGRGPARRGRAGRGGHPPGPGRPRPHRRRGPAVTTPDQGPDPRVIPVSEDEEQWPGLLEVGGEIIARGGLVVLPTDTVYGVGCDPFNSSAVDALFRAKRRGRDLPL